MCVFKKKKRFKDTVCQCLIAAVYVSINLCINTLKALCLGLIKCAVSLIKRSSSIFMHKTKACALVPVGFFSEYHPELKRFLCGFNCCKTQTEGRMCLIIFCFMSVPLVLS